MNRIYRSVWNEITRTFVAAAENVRNARGRGKASSGVCTDGTMPPASRSGAVLARRLPMPLALEQRFMFDGAAVADAAAAAAAAEAAAAIAAAAAPVEVRAADAAANGGKQEVVFVDTSLADYKTLEAAVKAGVAIVEIDGSKDGLAQIAKWAQAHSGYDSISILGHGSAATLYLGTTTLTSASLSSATVQTELAEIGQALTSDGDLMLYGCDVAKGSEGEAFIAALASATGADVAASSDATGSESKGGDWVLEKSAGAIDAASLSANDYGELLDIVTYDANDFNNGSAVYSKTVSAVGFTFASQDGYSFPNNYGTNYNVFPDSAGNNTNDATKVTIDVAPGYTFDLTSFGYYTSYTDTITLTLTYANNTTVTGTLVATANANITVSNFSMFRDASNNPLPISANDVTRVVIASANGTGIFDFGTNSYDISDVKAIVSTNATSTVTAGASSEATSFATTATSAASATSLLDFSVADPGFSDGVATNVSALYVNVSGTATPSELSQMTFLLSGPDATNVVGTYDSSTGRITFSGLNLSISDGGSETYSIKAYYNDNSSSSDITDKHTVVLSINASNFTTVSGGSTFAGSQANVTNGSGASIDVTATKLIYSQSPSTTVVSGVSFTTQPVVIAVDDRGNVDTDFAGTVTLSENGSGTLSGTTSASAANGVATFGGVKYTAASDADASFALTAASGVLASVTSASINPDVVATRLVFATQPAPTAIQSGASTAFSTLPVVQAVDANGTIDQDYASNIVLSLTDPNDGTIDGTVNSLTVSSGDQDASATTVTLAPSAGIATATGLIVQYTNSGSGNTLALRATSGSLTAVNSSALTSTAAPAALDLATASDSGSSNSDNITRNTTPTITGTAVAGSTVTLYDSDGSTVLGTATATGGVWSITCSALSAGTHTLTAKSSDGSGNVSPASAGLAITIDVAAPSTTVSTAVFSADTGSSNSDFITKTASQTVSGTLSANLVSGESVYVSLDNGGTWTAATTTAGSNAWSLAGQTLSASSTLQVKVSDAAGNDGVVYSQAYVLDTTAPTTTVYSAVLSNDTGSSGSDFVTSTAAQTISGTLSANLATGETVYVSLDNGSSWTAAAASVGSNAWSLAGRTLTASSTLKIKVSDTAGNDGSVLSQAYLLDTTAPTITFGTIRFSADTGSSNSDLVTSTAAQTITATLSAAPAGTDIVYGSLDNGSTWTDITAKVSGTTLSWNGVTLVDSDTLLLRVVDAAGNVGASTSQAYTLDTSAPTAPAAPVLTSASDSGTSASDRITNDATPTLTGTAEAGSTVTVYDGATLLGTTIASGGSWSYTTAALSAGNHDITAVATDAAGNASAASGALSITIDTSAPAMSSVAVPASGTYYSGEALDFTVNFNEVLTVNTSGGTPRIALTVGAATRYADYVSGSGTSALVFRYVVPSGDTDGNGISVGTALDTNGGSLKDAAGNDAVITLNSVGSTAGVNVDGSNPSVTGVGASTANGAYGAGQTITLTVDFSSAVDVDTSGGAPTLALTGGGQATYLGGSGSATLTFSYTVGAGQNSADLDYASTAALALNGATIRESGGAHQAAALTLATPGTAGSLAANKNIAIDTSAPASPTTLSLAAASDSGVSSSDGITSDTTPTVTGSSEANASIKLYDGVTLIGSTTADGSGAWSITSAALAAGTHTLTARATDAAGNVSTASSALALTIDTTTSAPTALALAAASGSGSATSDTTPTISGRSEPGSSVTLYASDGSTVLGTATANASGVWTITSTTLAEGAHTLTAVATDVAGNTSATSAALTLTIDTQAPAAPQITAASASKVAPTISGSAEAGSTVTLYDSDGATVVGSATANGSGLWSLTLGTLTAGSHTLTARASDAAGNASPVSNALSVSIEASVPPTPVVVTPTVVVAETPATPLTPATQAASGDPAPATANFIAPGSELAGSATSTTTLAALTSSNSLAAPAALPASGGLPSATPADAARAMTATPTLTQGGGFAVAVASSSVSPSEGLVVNRGVADQRVASGTTGEFSIPADAFAASNAATNVTLSAQQADGRPLPAWLSFDAASGKFKVQAPPGATGELTIRVVARDAQGHQAVTVFKVKLGDSTERGAQKAPPAGRAGLAEQIHMAARPHPALERLARLAGLRDAA